MESGTDRHTGIPGLDEVLTEGVLLNRTVLVEGPPGTGKTTLGLQFLLEGVRCGREGLFITLADSKAEILSFAASHGWTLDGITVLEVFPDEYLTEDPQTFFHPGEIELAEVSRRIMSEAERLRPGRVVIDSLSEIRLYMPDALRFHQQITRLKRFFTHGGFTVLMIEPQSSHNIDPHLETVVHGVIELEIQARDYGADRRRLRVLKLREANFVPGYHDYSIRRGGITVFPRIQRQTVARPSTRDPGTVTSGIPEMDALLGGGLQVGTSVLLLGTTGTGKSCMASHYAIAAAERGASAHIYLFDESADTMAARCRGLGMRVDEALESGLLHIEEFDPAAISPGEFVDRIRRAVAAEQAHLVIIDSLSGYLNALPEERSLLLQMHELLEYLHRRDITTMLIMAQTGVFGTNVQSSVDLSYLTDAIIVFRSFEAAGAVRKAVSVLKKRYGQHEGTIREYTLAPGKVHVGEPLKDFEGVLTGFPSFVGNARGEATPLEAAADGR